MDIHAEIAQLRARLDELEQQVDSEVLTEVRDIKEFSELQMSSPVAGTTFTGTSVRFQWADQIGTVWQFYVESQDGATTYHSTPSLQGSFRTVDTLPDNGEALRARLVGTQGGETKEITVNYTAWTRPVTVVNPSITSHVDGGDVNAGDVFTWSAGTVAVEKWWLIIGTGPNSPENTSIYNSKQIDDPLKLSQATSETNYPAVDATVLVKLSYMVGGVWMDVPTISLNWTAPTATNQSNAVHVYVGIAANPSGLQESNPIDLSGSSNNNVVIEGLKFTGAHSENQPMMRFTDIDTLTIQDCMIKGNPLIKALNNLNDSYSSHGIWVQNCQMVIIRRCDIWDTNMGVRLDGCYDWDIYDNTIHDTRYSSIHVNKGRGTPGSPHTIHNNHCFNHFEDTASRDIITYHVCRGVSETDRLRMDNNFCQNVNTNNQVYDGGKNGGSIMLGDGGDWSGQRQQYLGAKGNSIINGGHYLATIQGGHKCELEDNWGFMDEHNSNNNRGVGLSVFNQDNKTNTDYGWHTITNNRMNAVGRNASGQEVQNDRFLRNNADDRQDTWTISGNEYGVVTEAEVEARGKADTANARCFDHPEEYTPRV